LIAPFDFLGPFSSLQQSTIMSDPIDPLLLSNFTGYNVPFTIGNYEFNITEVNGLNITQFEGSIYPDGLWFSSNLSVTRIPNGCEVGLCSLEYANVRYVPNAGSNFLFAIIFAVFLLTQLIFWVLRRTHSFSFAMCCGLILEILGYLARVLMKTNMFSQTPFLM
jgi:hypothetical protein